MSRRAPNRPAVFGAPGTSADAPTVVPACRKLAFSSPDEARWYLAHHKDIGGLRIYACWACDGAFHFTSQSATVTRRRRQGIREQHFRRWPLAEVS